MPIDIREFNKVANENAKEQKRKEAGGLKTPTEVLNEVGFDANIDSGTTFNEQTNELHRLGFSGLIESGRDYSDQLAMRQSDSEKWGRSAIKFGKGILNGIIDNLASWDLKGLYDMGMGNTTEKYGNALNESEFGKWLKDEAGIEVYSYGDDFGSSAYWAKMFGDMGYTVGIMLETFGEQAVLAMLTGGVGNVLGAATKVNKIKNIVEAAHGAFSGIREAYMNALETQNNTYNKYKQMGFDEEYAQKKANEAATLGFRVEAGPVALLNSLQAMSIWGKFGKPFEKNVGDAAFGISDNFQKLAEKAFGDKVKNKFAQKALDYGLNSVSEAVEEGFQTGVGQYADAAVSGEDYDMWNEEMRDSMLMGAISGGLMKGLGEAASKFTDDSVKKDWYNKQDSFVADIAKNASNNFQKRSELLSQIEELNQKPTKANKKKVAALTEELKTLSQDLSYGIVAKALQIDYINGRGTIAYDAHIENLNDILKDLKDSNTEALKKRQILDENGNYRNGWDRDSMIQEVEANLKNATDFKGKITKALNDNTADFEEAYSIATKSINLDNRINLSENINKGINETYNKSNEFKLLSSDGQRRFKLETEQQALLNLQSRNQLSKEYEARLKEIEEELKSVPEYSNFDRHRVNTYDSLKETAIGANEALYTNNTKIDEISKDLAESKKEETIKKNIAEREKKRVEQAKALKELETAVKEAQENKELDEKSKEEITKKAEVKEQEVAAIEHIKESGVGDESKIVEDDKKDKKIDEDTQALLNDVDLLNQLFSDNSAFTAATVEGEEAFSRRNFDKTDKDTSEFKRRLENILRDIETREGRKATFEDFIKQLIKIGGKDSVENNFDAFANLYKSTGREIDTDLQDLYDRYFSDERFLIDNINEIYVPVEEKIQENTQTVKEVVQANQPIVNIPSSENAIPIRDNNTIGENDNRTELTTPKAALLGVQYQDVFEGDRVVRKEKSMTLNESKEIRNHFVLDYDDIVPGTELEVVIPDNYLDIPVSNWVVLPNGQLLNKPMPFKDYLQMMKEQGNDVSPTSAVFRDKVPLIARNENGNIFMLHDTDWYNVNNVSNRNNNQIELIKKAQAELRSVRQAILDNKNKDNKTTKIEVTGRSFGNFINRNNSINPSDRQPITLSKATGNTTLAIAKSGNVLVNKKENIVNQEKKLLNKVENKGFTSGSLYEIREVAKGEYIALRAITNDVTKGENLNPIAANNMKWALLAYLYLNSSTEGHGYIQTALQAKYGITKSKADAIRQAILDTTGNFDMESYFGMFVSVLKSTDLNDYLDNETGKYPIGQTYVSIDNGGAIKVINKDGNKVKRNEKKFDMLPKVEVQRLTQASFLTDNPDRNIYTILDNMFGEKGLIKATFNPSMEQIGQGRPFVVFSEQGDVIPNYSFTGGNTYDDYIKDNVKTNVQSFKITDKNGNEKWITDIQPTITYRIKSEDSTPQVLEPTDEKKKITEEKQEEEVSKGGVDNSEDAKLKESIAKLDNLLKEGKITQVQYDNTVLALNNKRYNGFYTPEEAESRRNFDIEAIEKLSQLSTNQIDGISIIEQDQLTDSLFYQALKTIKIDGNYVSLRDVAIALQEAPKRVLQPIIDNNKELIALYEQLGGMEDSIAAIKTMNDKYINILLQEDKLTSQGDEDTAKGSLFIKMEQFFAEELENIDLEENDELVQDENGEVETNYSQSSLERDVKVSFSNRLKMFFAGIEDKTIKGQTKKNLLGLDVYVNPDTAIGMLRDITTKIENSEKDLLDALRTKQDIPIYRELLHKLEANKDSQVINEILYKLVQAKLKMYMIYVSDNKLEMLNANNRDGIVRALSTWKNELKNSSVFMIQDGEHVYNKQYLLNVKKEITDIRNQNGVIKVEQLREIFKSLGLTVEDNVLEKAVNELQSPSDNKFKKINGILDKLIFTINNVVNLKDVDGRIKEKVYAEDYDFIANSSDVFKNVFAPYQVELNGSAIEKSFRVAGKTIQEAIQRNMSYDVVKALKDPESNLFKALENIPYSKMNYVLKLIKHDADVQNRLEASFTSLEVIKRKGAKSKNKMGINEVSESDYILTELGFFQNTEKQLGNNNPYNLYFRMGRAFTPTLSDKSQMLVMATPLLDLREVDFQSIDKNFTMVSPKVIDFMLSQLFDGEFDRIIQSYNKDFNIKSYNKAAKRFIGIPGFNTLTIPHKDRQINIHTALSKIYNDPAKVAHYKELYRKQAGNFLQKLIENEAKKKINLKNGTGEWIKANLYDVKNNVIKNLDNLYFSNKRMIGMSDEKKIIMLSYDKVINDLLTQNNIYQLFAGDMALYAPGTGKFEIKDEFGNVVGFDDIGFSKKTGENITKRMAMLIAPGSKLANTFDENGNPEKYYQLMVNDPVTITSMAEALIKQHYGEISNENRVTLENLKTAENKLANLYKNRHSSPNFDELLEEAIKEVDKYKSQLRKNNKSIEGYFDIEGTDAQEYTTWQEHMDILWRQGRLSKEQKALFKSAYDKLNRGIELDSSELSLVMNPIKPVYAGSNIVRDENSNAEINRVTYIKSSSFPLLPQLTKGLKIDKIRQQMESLQEKSGKKVRLSYQTANKVGAANTKLTVNDLYNLTSEELEKSNFKDGLLELDRNNFKIQQDTPYKTDKYLHKNQDDHIIMGSQMWKIILGGGISQMGRSIFPNKFDESLIEEINSTLPDKNKIVPKDEKLSGKDLDKIKFYVENKYSNLVKESLYKELGMSPDGSYNDRNELIKNVFKVLQREATTRDYPQSVLDGLRLYEENGNLDFNIPLWLSPGTQKFESLLQAIITNRLIKIHLPGGSHYSTASEGFEKTEVIGDDKVNISKVVWVDKNHSGELKATYVTDEKGKKVLKESEVLIQSKFRITTEENGNKITKLIDLTKEPYSTFNPTTGRLELNEGMIDKELLANFSYRIPTSSLQSGAILRVVGFIPEGNGDTIVVPKEHTKQIGEDFDIDKRNVYKENYVVDENGKISLLTRANSGLLENDNAQEAIEKLREEINSIRQKNKELFNRLEELEDISEEDETSLVKFILGEDTGFDSGEQKEIVKQLGLNKKEKTALFQELKEARGSLLSKRKSEDIEKKLLENAMIQVYKSVYSTTNNEVQKKINSILSFDVASQTANEINNKINGNKNEQFFTTLSSTYQREQMKLGASGKLGIGVHSNTVTFQAQLERLYGTKDEVHLVKYDTTDKPIPKTLTLGDIPTSDGRLGRARTLDGERTVSDVNAENQNSATDNVKAQIMGKRNENAYTINVLTMMTLRGFDMTITPVKLNNGKTSKLQYSSMLISQPIIRRYVELKEQQKSLTAEYTPDAEQEILKTLIKEFNINNIVPIETDKKSGSIIKTNFIKGLTGGEYPALTGQALYDNLDYSKSAMVQLQALQAFFVLEKESEQVNKIQKLISLNTSGLGVSYFNTIERIKTLDEIAEDRTVINGFRLIGDFKDINDEDKEGYTQIGKYYWKPNTTEGVTFVNSVSMADRLMQEFFPYKNEVISNAIGLILGDKKDTDNSKKYDIMTNLRDYIYTYQLGLFSGDINSERKRLFFDTKDNQSLASFISKIKNDGIAKVYFKNNQFLKNLDTIIDRTGRPSLIDSGIDNEINFSKSSRYADFLKLLYDDETILGNWNGENITPRKLAQDLATYAFLANDEGGSIGFRNFVNQNYLDIIGVSEKLRKASEDLLKEGDFSKVIKFRRQFIQHNPQYATKLEKDFAKDPDIDDIAIDKNNKIVRFNKAFDTKSKELIVDYYYVKNGESYDLYEFNPADTNYYLIPTLGTFGYNEYNYNNYVEKTLLPDNTGYLEIPDEYNYQYDEEKVDSSPKSGIFANKYPISTNGLKDLLQILVGQSTNNNHKLILEKLLPFLDSDTKLELVNGIGEDGKRDGMAYNHTTNTIKITKGVYERAMKSIRPGETVEDVLSEMILEEFIHSITINELSKYGNYTPEGSFIPNGNAPAFVQKLVKLYENAKEVIPENEENYYIRNIREFIAGVFIDDVLREKLDNTKVGDKSLLDKFKEAIRDLLRYLTGATYTDEAINSVMEMLQNREEVKSFKPNNSYVTTQSIEDVVSSWVKDTSLSINDIINKLKKQNLIEINC